MPRLNFLKNSSFFLVALIFVSVISRLTVWFYTLSSDHLLFFFVGREIANGSVLYLDVWDHKPPLIFYINAFMSILLGDNLVWHHIFLVIWMMVEFVIFYTFLKKLLIVLNQREVILKSRIALLFYALFRNLVIFVHSANNTENFGLVFVIMMYWFGLKWIESKSWKWLLASGGCLSVLVFLKPNFVILALPIFVQIAIKWLILLWSKHWQSLLIELLIAIRHYLIFLAPTLVQTIFWVWFFYRQGVLWEFWTASYLFSAKYLAIFDPKFMGSYYVLSVFINSIVFIFISIFFGLFIWSKRKFLQEKYFTFISLVIFSGWLFVLIFIRQIPYYFLNILPSIAISLILIDWTQKAINYWVRSVVIFMITLCSMMFIGFSFGYYVYDHFVYKEYTKGEYVINNSVYFRSLFEERQKVYVFDYGATLHYLNNTTTPTRYFSANIPSMDYTLNLGFGINDQIIKDLEKDQTEYVITRQDWLEEDYPVVLYIHRCYKEIKTLHLYTLMQRKEECSINQGINNT